MKKWFKFFCLSFFSDKTSKEAQKRGYTNVFLGLILSFVFLWIGYVGAEMLPFGAHYNSSTDFRDTVRSVFANPDVNKRIFVDVQDSVIKVKRQGGEYAEELLVNTFDSEEDRQNYSVNGYNIVIDSRPADALAEFEVYYISNDGRNIQISYDEYLGLSDVAKLNFDLVLKYTGKELLLTDELVEGYAEYLKTLGGEAAQESDRITSDLTEGKITKNEYNRSIYKLYFTNYYPAITDYETSSEVPLLRNSYYHNYMKQGFDKYLFVFSDYMVGSFETKSGIQHSFYGFYNNLDNGILVSDDMGQDQANRAVDSFVKKSYNATASLSFYTYAMNIFSLIPFIALMPMVVTLLAYSLLKLRGVDGIASLGGAFKIVGSYSWFSAVAAAVMSVIGSFFLSPNILAVLPLLLFFITLAVRAIIFAVNEAKSYINQSKQQETVHTEA